MPVRSSIWLFAWIVLGSLIVMIFGLSQGENPFFCFCPIRICYYYRWNCYMSGRIHYILACFHYLVFIISLWLFVVIAFPTILESERLVFIYFISVRTVIFCLLVFQLVKDKWVKEKVVWQVETILKFQIYFVSFRWDMFVDRKLSLIYFFWQKG